MNGYRKTQNLPKKLQPRSLFTLHCPIFRHKKAFTLFELIAVIAIITLISFASLPALRGFSSGNNRKAAAAMVSGYIDQARLAAQQYGVRTYLIFTNNCITSTTASPMLVRDVKARGMRIMRDYIPSIDPSTSSSIVPITRWVYLPKNIEFKINDGCATPPPTLPGGGTSDFLSLHSQTQVSNLPADLNSHIEIKGFSLPATLPVLVFSPDSSVDFSVTGDLIIYLGEIGRANPPILDAVRIGRYTGRATFESIKM